MVEKDIVKHKESKSDYACIYLLASLSSALIHFVYFLIFHSMGNTFLCRYNVFAVILYIICSLVIATQDDKIVHRCFSCIFLEIIIFINICCIMLGNQFGFGYILCGLIILEYYVMHNYTRNIRLTGIYSSITIILFIISNLISSFGNIPKVVLSNNVGLILYYMNMICGMFEFIVCFILFVSQTLHENHMLHRKNAELKNTANYDALTKLLNRHSYSHYMKDFFSKAINNGDDFAVILFDIDNFKSINDTYGHSNGDIVLKAVANVLSESIRPVDIAFRWGGEEFLVVVNGGKNVGLATAERCRNLIESLQFHFNDVDVKVTATSGVCPYYIGSTKELLVDKADEALYRGKSNGKNQVVLATY